MLVINKTCSDCRVDGLRSPRVAMGLTVIIAACPNTSTRRIRLRIASMLRGGVHSVKGVSGIRDCSCGSLSLVRMRLGAAIGRASIRRY